MRQYIRVEFESDFAEDESGAVTVDFIPLVGAVIGLGLAVVGSISGGLSNLTDDVSSEITGMESFVTASNDGNWFDSFDDVSGNANGNGVSGGAGNGGGGVSGGGDGGISGGGGGVSSGGGGDGVSSGGGDGGGGGGGGDSGGGDGGGNGGGDGGSGGGGGGFDVADNGDSGGSGGGGDDSGDSGGGTSGGSGGGGKKSDDNGGGGGTSVAMLDSDAFDYVTGGHGSDLAFT